MQNFNGEYLQVIERASRGCIISMRSICRSQKTWDADEKFAKEVSLSPRKGKMQMQFKHDRQAEKHLQVMKRERCRYIGLKKSIRNNEYQGIADTTVATKASATANIKSVQIHGAKKASAQANNSRIQIHQIPEKESPHRSTYFNHGIPPSKKRLCNPANWSRACPTKLSRRAQSFFCLEAAP